MIHDCKHLAIYSVALKQMHAGYKYNIGAATKYFGVWTIYQ